MKYYFASDIHLGLKLYTESNNEKKFLAWLDFIAEDADGIFLLGDIFDFWYEYKRVIPKCPIRVLSKFNELSCRGIPIHFFPGNHDMWVREFLAEQCGIIIHKDGELLKLDGRTVYVSHGDNVGFVGRKVAVMQKIFRSSLAGKLFSALVHPDAAMKFGQWWSQSSRKNGMDKIHSFKSEGEPGVKFARQYMTDTGIIPDYFIFGHLHCPTEFRLSDRTILFVLGDWVTDKNPVYGVVRDGEFTLEEFKI
ncbi:MAG: UDP-2,3-diacylglucosamine diphosphatase [Rikenellaceae bacterium]|nr:UDP-2,3-diacylglucosamine diphosphatase [Rikenellaceae bacterium]